MPGNYLDRFIHTPKRIEALGMCLNVAHCTILVPHLFKLKTLHTHTYCQEKPISQNYDMLLQHSSQPTQGLSKIEKQPNPTCNRMHGTCEICNLSHTEMKKQTVRAQQQGLTGVVATCRDSRSSCGLFRMWATSGLVSISCASTKHYTVKTSKDRPYPWMPKRPPQKEPPQNAHPHFDQTLMSLSEACRRHTFSECRFDKHPCITRGRFSECQVLTVSG
jgi:hypothetical protein